MEAWSRLFKDHVFQEGALVARTYPTGAQLFAQGRTGMMALGSWWMQESKFPPPLSQLIQNMSGFDFFYFPALTARAHERALGVRRSLPGSLRPSKLRPRLSRLSRILTNPFIHAGPLVALSQPVLCTLVWNL